MLKQAFGRGEELQEEVVPLSNIFSDRLDDLVDSSNNKDVISRRQKRNATSPRLPATGKNGVAGHSGIEEGAAEGKRVASLFGIELGIKIANGDLSDIRFSIEE